jgi:Arc/MetJ-type ribon-helix-helix transcriptional regulator
MADRTRVNLTVSPKQKKEWDRAVEDSTRYNSLSDLIRQSVAHELAEGAERGVEQTGSAEQPTVDSEALQQVTDTLSNMQRTLSDIDDRLTGVEQEVISEEQADLKNRVFAALPRESNPNEPEGRSAEQIADKIDADRDRVSNALLELQTATGTVDEAFTGDKGQVFWSRSDGQ